MAKLLVAALALALFAGACGRGDGNSVWQWVDEKGSVQFAESLDDVPQAHRARAGRIPMSAKALARKRSDSASAPAAAVAKTSSTPAATPQSVAPVTLYVSSQFANGADTIRALEAAGIAYTTIDVEHDEKAKDHVTVLTHKQWPNAGDGYATPMLEHEDEFFFGEGELSVALLALRLDWVRRGRPLETPAVYMTQRCGYSKELMEALDAIGQPYQALDVDFDGEAHGHLVEVTGSAGVPVTMVNGRVIHGYGPDAAKEIAAAAHPTAPGAGFFGFVRGLFGS